MKETLLFVLESAKGKKSNDVTRQEYSFQGHKAIFSKTLWVLYFIHKYRYGFHIHTTCVSGKGL